MSPHELLERAQDFAGHVHYYQERRDGRAYIEHPKQVAKLVDSLGGDLEAEALAWVHDTLEDGGPGTLKNLESQFDPNFVAQVKALTHLKSESYDTYLTRVIQYGWRVRLVKVADILDNLADAPTDAQRKKYLAALARIAR